MAILTWKDVVAPNLSGSQEGIRTAGYLLNQAVSGAEKGLGIFQDAQTQAAQQAIMNRALAHQDPQAYAQAMQQGQIVGPDGANAGAAFLQQMDLRQDTLQNRAKGVFDFGQAQVKAGREHTLFERSEDLHARREAGEQFLNQAIQSAGQGQEEQAWGQFGQANPDTALSLQGAPVIDGLLNRHRLAQAKAATGQKAADEKAEKEWLEGAAGEAVRLYRRSPQLGSKFLTAKIPANKLVSVLELAEKGAPGIREAYSSLTPSKGVAGGKASDKGGAGGNLATQVQGTSPQSQRFRQAAAKSLDPVNLSDGAKAVMAARTKGTLSPRGILEDIQKSLPKFNIGQVNDLLTTIQGMGEPGEISRNEAVEGLFAALQEEGFTDFLNEFEGTNVRFDKDRAEKFMGRMRTGKAELKSVELLQGQVSRLNEAEEKLHQLDEVITATLNDGADDQDEVMFHLQYEANKQKAQVLEIMAEIEAEMAKEEETTPAPNVSARDFAPETDQVAPADPPHQGAPLAEPAITANQRQTLLNEIRRAAEENPDDVMGSLKAELALGMVPVQARNDEEDPILLGSKLTQEREQLSKHKDKLGQIHPGGRGPVKTKIARAEAEIARLEAMLQKATNVESPAVPAIQAPSVDRSAVPPVGAETAGQMAEIAADAGASPIQPGNINLNNRPVVNNPDGSFSTVGSMSYGTDEGEILIPTVSDEGKHMSGEEAIKYWEKKGQHLGIFRTPEEATAYAEALHEHQEILYQRRRRGTATRPVILDDDEDIIL